MGILIVLGLLARAALSRSADAVIPDDGLSIRGASEVLVEWLDGFVHDVTELHGHRAFVSFFGCLFVFILFCNFFGLIPGMEPPTGNSDLTFALGTVSFFYFLYRGARAQGIVSLLRNEVVGPVWWLFFLMVPINLADIMFRPFSLGVRLYANMFADHTVLSIFTGLTKLVVPLAFYALGSIVCVIQAIIFLVLSMAYVRLATSHAH